MLSETWGVLVCELRRWRLRLLAALAIGVSLTLLAGTGEGLAASGSSGECPNQAFRVGASVQLPDCRAYEMVTPVEKGGANVTTLCDINCWLTALNEASIDGEKFTFSSSTAFGDAVSAPYSSQYLATRGSEGWSTHAISPPHRAGLFTSLNSYNDTEVMFKAFTPDLSSAWLLDDGAEPLTANALKGYPNVYRRDNEDESYEPLTIHGPTISGTPYPALAFQAMQFVGYSANGEQALFETGEPLTSESTQVKGHVQLYDYSDGALYSVGVLPNGEANPGYSNLGTQRAGTSGISETHGEDMLEHAISADGSRIYWTAQSGSGSGPGQLYLRENPNQPQSAIGGGGECTEPAKACTLPVSSGAAQFWTANTEGSEAIFSEGEDLYRYDLESHSTSLIAGEVAGVLGAGEDLSYLYYVSKEALASGAIAGEYNLYLDQAGTTTFVTMLSAQDLAEGNGVTFPSDAAPVPYLRTARVTPDGRHIAFQSDSTQLSEQVAGYDNTDAVTGEPDIEVYAYEAGGVLNCVSCNPAGAPPVGQLLQDPYHNEERKGNGGWINGVEFGDSAWINTAPNSLYAPRELSADGDRLFFNSYEALVQQDTDGTEDVYEWERPGTGSCEAGSSAFSAPDGGCIYLISSGESPETSEFVDATPEGGNVFISTSSSLLPQDPGLVDIYDARVDGGFAPPAAQPALCEGETCQSLARAVIDQTPASLTFSGPGNQSAVSAGTATKKKTKKTKKTKKKRKTKTKTTKKKTKKAKAKRKQARRHGRGTR